MNTVKQMVQHYLISPDSMCRIEHRSTQLWNKVFDPPLCLAIMSTPFNTGLKRLQDEGFDPYMAQWIAVTVGGLKEMNERTGHLFKALEGIYCTDDENLVFIDSEGLCHIAWEQREQFMRAERAMTSAQYLTTIASHDP